MKYRYVLFDLDGTLLDTNELILRSFEHALETHVPGQYTREHVLPHMGEALIDQMERFVPGRSQELVATYRKFNIEHHDALVTEFPQVNEVLEKLHQAGIKMAIVTSKMRLTAQMGWELVGIGRYFDAFVTADDTEKHKPHPDPLLMAMRLLGADPEQTLMVGDSPYDILGGQAAGVKTAAVAWSLRGEAGLREHKPDYMIHDMQELQKILLETR
ncbi:pyrophosphatase PpaX [Tumebacillus algifaecis]|uniref:Pyrophosphatase PpaX n=1 Tax=Tumebacillus algifaecis TaxID=1214604 RepID=A0A223D4N3_9BACL|nr:pyrophosphatase PpaX [Tumebacillus algifaecis]ASS76552.1 pyrophosphatase PpaX [Tumebacillus algifaecis]